MRRTIIGSTALALILVSVPLVTPASALVVTADQIQTGTSYAGDSGPSATHPEGSVEGWRLGGTGKGSRIVVDVTNERPSGPLSVCMGVGPPKAWAPGDEWCYLAPAVSVDPGTTRVTFVTGSSSYESYIDFGDPGSGAVGPYRFTLVSHELLLEVGWIRGGRTIDRKATLKTDITLGGEGEYPAPKGTQVTVEVRKNGRTWTRTGQVLGRGTAAVRLRLPARARGRATLVVTAAKQGYVTSATVTKRVRIR
jgi:hypothetical protein